MSSAPPIEEDCSYDSDSVAFEGEEVWKGSQRMSASAARDDMASYMKAYRAKKKRKRQCLECKESAVEGQRLCPSHSEMHRILQRSSGSKK